MKHSIRVKDDISRLYRDQRHYADETVNNPKGTKEHRTAQLMLNRVTDRINSRNDFIYDMSCGKC